MPQHGPALAEDAIVPLHRILERGLARDPEGLAFVSLLTGKSWRNLEEAATRYARNLLALGLRPGDRVASLMPNRVALLVHYLGCLKARLVATPLNYRYMAPEIDHALEVSGASILLTHVERAQDLAESKLANRLPLGRISYAIEDDGHTHFSALLKDPPAIDLPVPKPDDPAIIFFTSGSTGKPKGVTHTHETFGRLLASIVASFALTPNDRFLPGSSASHIGGLALSLGAFAAGSCIVGARSFNGAELLPLLRLYRPTLLSMLPAALFMLERDHDAKREDFESLRTVISGGDKVSQTLEDEFTRLAGYPIRECFGMSEIGFASLQPAGVPRPGSVGKPVHGYAFSVRDERGRELPPGEEGRLWVRSPANMIGYWNRPDATKETIVDGWLDSGDVMKVDEAGFFWFCGRKKQIIVHDGSNICPQEVEEAVESHPAVDACGVVGIHDLVHGENVRAYVTLKPSAGQVSYQEVITLARSKVGYKAPEDIVVLAEMPLNATGKVDRVALKRMAEEQEHPADRAA